MSSSSIAAHALPVVANASAAAGAVWQLVDSSGVGGIERHVAVLSEALSRRGLDCRVVLYADHGSNPWITQLDAAGLHKDILTGSVFALISKARRERPSLIHTHGYKAGILGRIVAFALGIPSVSTFHAGERGPWPVCAYQAIDAWTSGLSARIAVSEQIARCLPYASELVPNFVPQAKDSGARKAGRNIGFVGRLSHEKGPDLFCELADHVGQSFNWHIYGDGPMRGQLEAAYGQTVQFHGVVSDMDQVWRELDVLVISSRAEGLPMVALEAMAHGIPVIASRVGALPNVIEPGQCGWLYEPGDIPAASDCIVAFLNARAEGGAALAARCRARVAREYSVERGVERILAVYRRAGFKD